MQKYKVTAKLKKTRYCSYYTATNLISGQTVTIKKLSGGNNWDELLKKREVSMMKQPHYPFLARIKQIIKENGKFFVVHEQLTQCVDDLKKKALTLAEVTNIGRQMVEIVMQLRKEQVVLYELRPQFFFVNKKRVKLAHIVSLDEKSRDSEPPDYKYFAPEMTLNDNEEEMSEQTNVFSIGCILCELLLGKPLIQAKNKLDYMYIVCGLYPKQKMDGQQSQIVGGDEQSQPTKSFEYVMEPVCSSHELIDLLGDMTRVNCRYRLKLEQALRRMKNLHVKFDMEQKDRSLSKRRLKGNSMDSSTIIERMTRKVQQVSRERDRYKSPEAKQPQTPMKSTKIISTNHQINLSLDSDLYDRIGYMPPIPRECAPLRLEKNVQDNAAISSITRQKNYSQMLIPVSNISANRSTLPSINTKQAVVSRYPPTKPVNYNISPQRNKDLLDSVAQTRNKKMSISTRIKTEEAPQLHNLQPQVVLANPRNRKGPQLTNYALNNNGHLGVQLGQEDIQFGSQSDFG